MIIISIWILKIKFFTLLHELTKPIVGRIAHGIANSSEDYRSDASINNSRIPVDLDYDGIIDIISRLGKHLNNKTRTIEFRYGNKRERKHA